MRTSDDGHLDIAENGAMILPWNRSIVGRPDDPA